MATTLEPRFSADVFFAAIVSGLFLHQPCSAGKIVSSSVTAYDGYSSDAARSLFGNLFRLAVLFCSLALTETLEAQNYGLWTNGASYAVAGATPAPTPAPGSSPPPVLLPLPVYAVSAYYTLSKDVLVATGEAPSVTSSYTKRLAFIARSLPASRDALLGGSSQQNYVTLYQSVGRFELDSGVRELSSESGVCNEESAFLPKGGCSSLVVRQRFAGFEQPPEVLDERYQLWPAADITSRPYSCTVRQYTDPNGRRLAVPHSYSEQNRLNLWVDGLRTHRYRVRLTLNVHAITPHLGSLFSQERLSAPVSAQSLRLLPADQVALSHFVRVSGSANVYEGVVIGQTPTALQISAPAHGRRRAGNGSTMSSFDCFMFSITNLQVLQDIGD